MFVSKELERLYILFILFFFFMRKANFIFKKAFVN